MPRINFKNIIILLLLSYVFFFLGNGLLSLTNPDEVFYAQTAKEMIQHKTWMTEYLFNQPQFEKPILTYWCLRIAFFFGGVTPYAARFFTALFAFFGVIAVYLLATVGFKDQKKAFLSALVLMSVGFYIALARTVFTDMIFSIFILLALTAFFLGYTERKKKSAGILLFFIFSSLAVLTKGPLGILIPFAIIVLFLLIEKELKFLFCKELFFGFVIFSVISLPWYVAMIKKYGKVFIDEFFYNDHYRRLIEAEHGGNDTWYFYLFTMFACMFPWSLYLIPAFGYFFKCLKSKTEPIYIFLACWIGVVFLTFQFAHSKLTSYIFPLFPALAIITGDFIYNSITSQKQRFVYVISFILWFILALIPAGLIISAYKLIQFAPPLAFVWGFAFIFILYLIVLLFYLIKRRLNYVMYLLSFSMLLILFFAILGSKNFEAYVSSKYACDYLMKNYKVENAILCAKPFIRGVRFYTDKDVAYITSGSSKFFSPHPFVYLDSREKQNEFLKKQKVTYCVLTKTYFSVLKERASENFKIELLKIIGNEYIVRVTKDKELI